MMRDSRNCVEIVLRHAAVCDVALLIHRVVVEPHDLAFELLFDRQRIDQTEPFVMRDIDALQPHLALLADRNGVDLRADGRMVAGLGSAFFERDGPRRALAAAACPSPTSRQPCPAP